LDQSSIFINFELEEEALREMTTFRERLEFNKVLGLTPAITGGRSEEKAASEKRSESGERTY
jgi:hypothetical protein